VEYVDGKGTVLGMHRLGWLWNIGVPNVMGKLMRCRNGRPIIHGTPPIARGGRSGGRQASGIGMTERVDRIIRMTG